MCKYVSMFRLEMRSACPYTMMHRSCVPCVSWEVLNRTTLLLALLCNVPVKSSQGSFMTDFLIIKISLMQIILDQR